MERVRIREKPRKPKAMATEPEAPPASPPPAAPSPTVDNGGRGANGQFTAGNHFGRGNPYAQRVGQFRNSLIEAVTPEDVVRVVKRLVKLAAAGDVPAMKLLFDRILGRVPLDITEIMRAADDEYNPDETFL